MNTAAQFAETNDADDAMPADLMDQIRRSMARMALVQRTKALPDVMSPGAVAIEELTKIFAAYDREPVASDPCVKMRAIWGIP